MDRFTIRPSIEFYVSRNESCGKTMTKSLVDIILIDGYEREEGIGRKSKGRVKTFSLVF